MVKLGEVASYINGYAFKPEDRGSEGLPIIRIQDLTGNSYDLGYYSGNYPKKIEINDGDILISWSASLGVYTWNKGKALLNQHIFKVEFIEDSIDKKYFVYAVRKKIDEMIRKSHGATMKHIIKKDFEDTIIPYPTLEEQYKIADELDRISKIIDMRNQELRLHDDLIRARFVEMFGNLDANPHGWNKSLLSNVILNANNGMSRRGDDKYGNIVIRLIELQEGFIDYSRPNRIMLKDHEKKRYLLKEKDVLFARVNGNPNNVGRCAVFYDIDEDVYHNDHIIRVHFDEKILDAIFASTVLNSDYGKRQLMGKVKTSAGQYTVSQDGIGSILIALPPIEMQQEFTTFVKEVNKSKVEVQKALDKAQLLFDSLMQKYFG